MSTVRDPNFWHRFSVAVHQDDALKEEMAQRPDLKHSYVSSFSEIPSPVTTPTSQSHLTTNAAHPQPLSPVALWPLSDPAQEPAATSQPTTPTTPKPKREPSRLKKTQDGYQQSKPKPAKSPRRPSLAHNPFRHGNNSQLTLGLSGRPQSRFKFWTSVTADPSNRNSWLESQQRKKRQRTWMCWAFWLCLLALIAGVVVTILLLKAKKII